MLRLARIDSELMALEKMDAAIMYKHTAQAIERIRKHVAKGLDPRKIKGLNKDGFFGIGRRIRADLLNNRERIMQFGRGQVNDEIKRQTHEASDG